MMNGLPLHPDDNERNPAFEEIYDPSGECDDHDYRPPRDGKCSRHDQLGTCC